MTVRPGHIPDWLSCPSSNFTIGEKLGTGGFGTVWAGVRRRDGVKVAIKHVSRTRVINWDTCHGTAVPRELTLMLRVQNVPGVVKILEFYERKDSFIFIMERPENVMDLFDFINKEKELSETLARDFFLQAWVNILTRNPYNAISTFFENLIFLTTPPPYFPESVTKNQILDPFLSTFRKNHFSP